MRTNLLLLPFGPAVLLAICSFGARADDDADDLALKKAIDAAKVAVLKLAHDPTKSPQDLSNEAADLAKQHELWPTHKLFGLRRKGGIGIGRLIGPGHKDSIESLIRDYSIKPPTKAEVIDYADDLVKAARVSLVIAEITAHWLPIRARPGAPTPGEQRALAEEMKRGSVELLAATKARDELAVANAAKRLNSSCAGCHRIVHEDR